MPAISIETFLYYYWCLFMPQYLPNSAGNETRVLERSVGGECGGNVVLCREMAQLVPPVPPPCSSPPSPPFPSWCIPYWSYSTMWEVSMSLEWLPQTLKKRRKQVTQGHIFVADGWALNRGNQLKRKDWSADFKDL